MSAPSPDQLAVSNPNCTISTSGTPLPTTVQLISVDIWQGVNKIPRARIVVSDGTAAQENFPLSETSSLIPGATLTISMGYGSTSSMVFSGVINRQGIEVALNGPSRLIVEATDTALVMTLARHNALFENLTDSQLFTKLITANGLSAQVTSTSTVYPSLIQYYASDWDLLVMRAQINSMVVIVDSGVVKVLPPATDSTPVLTLTYGSSLLDFRAHMDASTQFSPSAIQSLAWNPATQTLAKGSQAQSSVTTPGNISSKTLSQVFNVSNFLQQTPGTMTADELTQWSSAELMLSQLSKIRGEARFQGSALAKPGCTVTLQGLGSRFNGNAYISGTYHSYCDGLWRTTVEIGLSHQWFANTAPNIPAPNASGQLPPVNHLQSGTVLQIDQDPDNEFRVLIQLPLLESQGENGIWARFGSFYASQGIGCDFYPEIGDEVIVAFMGGDSRYPVVLGSLYSKKNPPPSAPTADNNIKSLVTRSKLRIEFDEKSPAITIITPGQQSVKINDSDKSVQLTDMNGNSVVLNSSGIELSSAANITLSAKAAINITAEAELNVKSTSSAQIKSGGPIQIIGATVALNP